MDFELGESLEAVRDLAGQILGDLTTAERMGSLGTWLDREAWQRLAEAGLLGISLPEATGGAGLDMLGAHQLLEAVGRTAAQVPVSECIVMGALPLATFAPETFAEVIAGVIEGRTLVTAALNEEPPTDITDPRTSARLTDSGWELVGTKTAVPLATLADVAIVSATSDDGVGLWVVELDNASVRVVEQDVLGGFPTGEIVLDRTQVSEQSLLGATDGRALTWLLHRGAAALSSQVAGACDGALRLAADYTSNREQFGRKIATFQAVAQRLADAFIDVEAASLTSLQAAWRLSEGLDADEEVAIAKWWAAEAGHRVLHAAQHVHGGIGVDRSYPLHRYFAMVKHLEFQLGNATTHLLTIGRALAAEPA